MKKWSSIEQFRHVVRYVKDKCEYDGVPLPTLLFRGTVKLHGTNAGIRRENGEYIAQGRNRVLTPSEDNFGFANWLHDNLKDDQFKDEMDQMFNAITEDPSQVVTIYGEWCGKGIQNKVAVSQLSKRFVVFGADVNGTYVSNFAGLDMPSFESVDNVLKAGVIFQGVDFNEPEKALAEFEKLTLEVERCCPYGKLHGVEGIGEGIVWVCVENPEVSSLWFKTKGEKHSGKSDQKDRKVATVDPEKMEKMTDLVDYVLTPGRLQQGLEHVDSIDMKCMGQYLKWIGQDVQKEEADTIETNGLEWKDIAKMVNTKAREHFKKIVEENF